MTQRPRFAAIAFAAFWGVFAAWLILWLDDPIGRYLLSVFHPVDKWLLARDWTGEQIKPLLHLGMDIGVAVPTALVLAVPLGLASSRALIAEWFAFVLAFVIAAICRTSELFPDIGYILQLIFQRLIVLILCTTLLFAFLVRRARARYTSVAA